MGTIYSISRIGTFEDCRLRYKYQYVDHLKADKETIEAFMGSRAHEALAELYGFVKNGVIKPREWLLARYDDLWDKNLTPAIKVVRSDYAEDDYRRKGRKCLDDYYGEYAPFDQAKVVATEKEISFKLKDGNDKISFRGIIDRLDWNDKEKITRSTTTRLRGACRPRRTQTRTISSASTTSASGACGPTSIASSSSGTTFFSTSGSNRAGRRKSWPNSKRR